MTENLEKVVKILVEAASNSLKYTHEWVEPLTNNWTLEDWTKLTNILEKKIVFVSGIPVHPIPGAFTMFYEKGGNLYE